jgi:hypothetical protein
MLDSLSGRNLVDLAIALKQLSANAHDTTTVNVIATVSNLGPDTPPTVILDLAMPSGLTFSRVASKSIRFTLAPLRCVLAQLLPGTRAEAVFTLRVTRLGTRELAAHVFSPTTTDPDPASARARLTIRTHRLT